MITVTKIDGTDEDIDKFLNIFRKEVIEKNFIGKKRDEAETAILEALSNAQEHGGDRIVVSWKLIPRESLVVHVCDEGYLKKRGKCDPPQAPELLPPLSEPRGRGLFLINELADSSGFERLGKFKLRFKLD